MSIQAVGWALDHSESRGFARLVLIALCNHAGATDECWPAQRTIAREAGISAGSVAPQIRKLVALGDIEVVDPGSPRRPARYRVLWRTSPMTAPDPDSPNPAPTEPTQRSGGERSKRAAAAPQRAAQAERQRAAQAAQNHQEPSENHHSAGKPAAPRKRGPRDDLYDALVAAFGPASTPSRSAFYGRTVTELVAAGATPQQVQRARIAMSRRGWDSPTPEAMVKHWDALLADRPAGPTNPAASRWWEGEEP